MKKLFFAFSFGVILSGEVLGESYMLIDERIEEIYTQPEVIPQIDKECIAELDFSRGKFNLGMQNSYYRAILCQTWENNKKMTPAQIKISEQLKSVFSHVIADLYSKSDNVLTELYDDFEYQLQLSVRFHNLLNKTKLSECSYEVVPEINKFNTATYPCNTVSEITKNCLQKEQFDGCVAEMLIQKYKNSTPKINQLVSLTEEFINSIISEPQEQQKEIQRLLNFYGLVFYYIEQDIRYQKEHDV